jgi:hypothetical protein
MAANNVPGAGGSGNSSSSGVVAKLAQLAQHLTKVMTEVQEIDMPFQVHTATTQTAQHEGENVGRQS